MCTRKLLKPFQHLQALAGYEILRIADDKSKNLMEIPMSGSGYSVSYLKGTLGQAKAYVRPIQKDLSLEVSNVLLAYFRDLGPCLDVVTCRVTRLHSPLLCRNEL